MGTPLGEVLLATGLVDEMQLNAALAHQRQWGGRLGDILIDRGFVDEMAMYQALAKHQGLTLVSIPSLPISPELIKAFPQPLCERHTIFPLRVQNKTLFLAVDNPKNVAAVDEVQFNMQLKVHLVMAPSREIEWAIRRYYHGESSPCPEPKQRVVVDEFKLTDASGNTLVRNIDDLRREHRAKMGAGGGDAAAMASRPAQTPLPGAEPSPTIPQYVTHEQFHVLQKSIEGMQQVLRFLIDMSIHKGVFTREEYMAYIEQLRRQG